MNIALVGNNDGPLVLLNSLIRENLYPICIGLQKPVNDALQSEYDQCLDTTPFFTGFDENILIEYLKDHDIDLLINCFCNFKFIKLLRRYEVLNVHLAPLPKYRGRHPLHWALINGESEFGVTVHRMDKSFDSGAILWQKMVPVETGMSVAALRQALMENVASDFGKFMVDYQNGQVKPQSNPNQLATYAPRRFPEDSRLTEWHDGGLIFRKVMALSSEQNPAFLRLGNQDIPVLSARRKDVPLKEKKEFASVHRIDAQGIEVLCMDGIIIGLYGFRPEKYGFKLNQRIL